MSFCFYFVHTHSSSTSQTLFYSTKAIRYQRSISDRNLCDAPRATKLSSTGSINSASNGIPTLPTKIRIGTFPSTGAGARMSGLKEILRRHPQCTKRQPEIGSQNCFPAYFGAHQECFICIWPTITTATTRPLVVRRSPLTDITCLIPFTGVNYFPRFPETCLGVGEHEALISTERRIFIFSKLPITMIEFK